MQSRETFYVMPAADGRVWEVVQSIARKTALFATRIAAELYARDQAQKVSPSEIVSMSMEGRITERIRFD